jgi:hypothetical protein
MAKNIDSGRHTAWMHARFTWDDMFCCDTDRHYQVCGVEYKRKKRRKRSRKKNAADKGSPQNVLAMKVHGYKTRMMPHERLNAWIHHNLSRLAKRAGPTGSAPLPNFG